MKLREHIQATYAAVGQELTDLGLAAMLVDLRDYPLEGVSQALARCRRELRRISLADIIERIPGGLPGPEEAWSIVARALNNEGATVVWTEEIATAFGAASALSDDPVAARMAFKECYSRLAAESRVHGRKPRWMASLGWDATSREAPIRTAVELGRLPQEHALKLLPDMSPIAPQIAALLEQKQVEAA